MTGQAVTLYRDNTLNGGAATTNQLLYRGNYVSPLKTESHIGIRTMRKPLALFAIVASAATVSVAQAQTTPESEGMYAGVFGGVGAATATSLQQRGAVILPAGQPLSLLPINAQGSTSSSTSVALGGAQLGYEWSGLKLGSDWAMRPAAELEGIYIGKHSPTGEMPVMPRFLGMQYVTVPTTVGALMANAVFTFETPYSKSILPYIGVGAGVAHVSIKGADSANPSEPGINHFNSDPDASDTAFAVQFKAGLKGEITKRLTLFAEYRRLSINSTSYKFGATDYPGVHFPTHTWKVDMGRQNYNLFVAGLQYKF